MKEKLVRDRIAQLMEAAGKKPTTRIAEPAEYPQLLQDKLHEEVNELCAHVCVEEMADVLEVLRAIAEHKHYDWQEIERVREQKAVERGGFVKRIVLKTE